FYCGAITPHHARAGIAADAAERKRNRARQRIADERRVLNRRRPVRLRWIDAAGRLAVAARAIRRARADRCVVLALGRVERGAVVAALSREIADRRGLDRRLIREHDVRHVRPFENCLLGDEPSFLILISPDLVAEALERGVETVGAFVEEALRRAVHED